MLGLVRSVEAVFAWIGGLRCGLVCGCQGHHLVRSRLVGARHVQVGLLGHSWSRYFQSRRGCLGWVSSRVLRLVSLR